MSWYHGRRCASGTARWPHDRRRRNLRIDHGGQRRDGHRRGASRKLRTVPKVTALVVCGAVFAVSLLVSWRLGRFIADCDRRLDEAERFDDIIAAEYTSDPASWPRAIRYPS